MKRVRWLSAQWPISMRTLASRMKHQLFAQESLDGFVIERVRDDLIEGHYIEKLSFKETITDPFGRQSVFERVGYRQIDFTLYADFPNIELREAHRSTREFVSRLMELCEFSVTIEPVSVRLLDWVKAVESTLETGVIVDSFQVSGVEFGQGVFAKMLLSGSEDVRVALGSIPSKAKFELDKLQMKVSVNNRKIPIHITSSANAKIPDDYWDELLPVLRKSLKTQN